jgi:ABC-type transport system substrate-binding protein
MRKMKSPVLRRWLFACLACSLSACATLAAAKADPSKQLRVAFEGADDGFDLAHSTNAYTIWVGEAIFEPLLTYDYLARPAKLVPLVAEAMPEVADGGRTYTFRLKKGILFAADPAFNGKPRELTAQDYIYTFKRLLDPANRSPAANFLAGKIVGLDELAAQAKKSGRFDYDAPVAGLQATDKYGLRIRLNRPDYNFLYSIAYCGLGAVAREVIDAYGAQSRQHPVGTGPYMLHQYVPRSKIVLAANPDYRGYVWDFKSSGDAWDEQIVLDMKGKQMPQVGRVEVSIIEEEQSRWLAFQGEQLDFDKLPQVAAPTVLDGNRLKPAYAAQRIRINRVIDPEITYTLFNMKDPLIGGYSKEKIALRRAIAMAYNTKEEIALIRNGQAVRAEMMVPPGVVGFDPVYRSSLAYDPALANKLLDRFGYKRGADGFRGMPDGSPLTLRIHRETQVIYQEMAELWKRGLDQIGIRADQPTSNFADNLKAATECKLMMWGSSWSADFPDGENFLQILYGPNAGQGNHSCYQSAVYDAMYLQALALPAGTERKQLYLKLNRQMEADTPLMTHSSRVRSWLLRPWVKGFKRHPILQSDWQYLDVEKH